MARFVVERGNEKGVSLHFGDEDCTYIVGRTNQCHLVLTDGLISRQHFKVEKSKNVYSVQDLQSYNGTYVNGVKIEKETLLLDGDTVRIGETLFSFHLNSGQLDGALCGKKIGGYHLIERIGIGGMGEVYKAIQTALARQVALKILSPDLTSDRSFVEKFLSEARAAGKLNHPNVVGVHEAGEDGGHYFISMEYVGGGSVQDLLGKDSRLDQMRATEIVRDAAKALQYAEKVGIVHCDIKPDNLMLTETNEVRLADLGIAKFLNDKGKADQAEGVFGSPHYMAPEQARGLALDNKADLYSLGVTFYRMLSGELPFRGKDAKEIMEKQVFDDPQPLALLVDDLAPKIYRIVDRMMRKKPGERYQTASALLEDLEVALDQIRNLQMSKTGETRGTTRLRSTSRRNSISVRKRRSRYHKR